MAKRSQTQLLAFCHFFDISRWKSISPTLILGLEKKNRYVCVSGTLGGPRKNPPLGHTQAKNFGSRISGSENCVSGGPPVIPLT